MSLEEKIRSAVEGEISSDLDRIDTRKCSGKNYEGVEYTLYGSYVPVRPIIDNIAKEDGKAIESIAFTPDHLVMFVGHMPKGHPAFTPEGL